MSGFSDRLPGGRKGTGSLKWDGMEVMFGSGTHDAIPMWVADMDFPCPEAVSAAVLSRARHNVYGYPFAGERFRRAVAGWVARSYGWEIDEEWVVPCSGVVSSIATSIIATTSPGDGVLIQPPVYYPFANCIRGLGRRLVENPLILENGRYAMDEKGLREALKGVKAALFCSPHNPVGRVWSGEELAVFTDSCSAAGVTVISDEIHADIILGGRSHKPAATAGGDPGTVAVTCCSTSKTFNTAGLSASAAIVPDPGMRTRFVDAMRSIGHFGPSLFGIEALVAAYTDESCREWLRSLLAYLEDNLAFLKGQIAAGLPGVKVIEPEGTYLAWLDCRDLGMDDEALAGFFMRDLKMALDPGIIFGTGGSGFMRLNFACPRENLSVTIPS